VGPGLARHSGKLLHTNGSGIAAAEVDQETPSQGHAIGTCTDAVGQKTSSAGLRAPWNGPKLQATRARESHQKPDSCSRPVVGFRVWSEAHILLASGRSHLVRPRVCVRMTLILRTAIEASSVHSRRDMGMRHPETIFETMPRRSFVGMSQSLPKEPWDWSASIGVACCLSLCGRKDWENSER